LIEAMVELISSMRRIVRSLVRDCAVVVVLCAIAFFTARRAVAAPPPAATQDESTTATTQPAPATSPGTVPGTAPASADQERFNVHFQATVIPQGHDVFHAPYSGPNSLRRVEPLRTSFTSTLFLGLRMPWEGGAVYFDPEVAAGKGLSGVTGIASFPNGDISHVGSPQPEIYVARAYFQQVFGLGGDKEKVESDQNQLAGYQDARRITLWLGKFSATDMFDGNGYSHDPRTQFMNESFMDDTAWDYPADARGYTDGVAVEYNEPSWAIRYGAFREPKDANGQALDAHFPEAMGHTLELEDRWSIKDQPGVVRVLGYANIAHMGNYREAIDNPGPNGPDITLSRTYSAKYGYSVSAEQAITPDLGIWGRAGWNDGHTESWAFTEVDRLASLGISLKGTKWGRPDDVVGIAGAIAGLSKDHRDYLRSGGVGFIIGDGKLHYAPEQVIEAYYDWQVIDHLWVTPDFQFVDHPAYNADRGPVAIWGLRVHVEF
jgi:high affinity Mn2+ porin